MIPLFGCLVLGLLKRLLTLAELRNGVWLPALLGLRMLLLLLPFLRLERRRKKSTLVAPVSWYIGSETAVCEGRPSVAMGLPGGFLDEEGFWRPERPRQTIVNTVRRMPKIMPGKKPTRIAVGGKALHCESAGV